jgi:hypothetical protein
MSFSGESKMMYICYEFCVGSKIVERKNVGLWSLFLDLKNN